MKVLSNTALACNKVQVTYEILLSQSMLVFKPAFYFEGGDFPCVILTRNGNAWKFQDDIDKTLQEQILDDINCLKIR